MASCSMVKLMARSETGPGTARHLMEKTMKAEIPAAHGSATMTLEPRPAVEKAWAGPDARRSRPARPSEPAAPDFAPAMRRVEAECYDTL